ncbi:MAG: hypothetical protein JXR89_06215 [Deltaproteobacteria bacterium]|nr:hypothetical protein [Deltaproteobacteria bacterium]
MAANVIDITEILARRRTRRNDLEEDEQSWLEIQASLAELDGKLNDIGPEAFASIKRYVLLELKIMLGLTPLEEDDIEKIIPVFADDIMDLYDSANEACYFCSDMVDPLEEAYGEFRSACPICVQKLKSFLEAAGVENPEAILKKAKSLPPGDD